MQAQLNIGKAGAPVVNLEEDYDVSSPAPGPKTAVGAKVRGCLCCWPLAVC